MEATLTAPAPTYRFAAGARERMGGTFATRSAVAITGAQQMPDTVDLAAGDFTAGVYLECALTTAGNAATVVFAADGPFSAIKLVEVQDPQGITFQTYTGYELALINGLGGYTGMSDPTQSPSYSATAGVGGGLGGSALFFLRIPAELNSREGIGAFFNGATSAQFKVKLTIGIGTEIYTTPPTTLPAWSVKVNTLGYQIPFESSPTGVKYDRQPPGGAIFQNWNRQEEILSAAGNQQIVIKRRGFLWRQIIFIFKDVSGARVNTLVTSDIRLRVDNVDSINCSYNMLRHITYERNRYATAAAFPAGVVQQSWCHEMDGTTGGETRDLYVATTPGTITNLEFTTGAAGRVIILVNDVSPTDQSVAEGVFAL